ncbi:hypothetical protein [Hasllibacter sp. MH4015]|uniref:hypothetical protein n=1 Tax=Hasllibacter sp. MH4015 TaxID=2854029 RepID=UPI001CD66D50|nr:hypothetical protein [Hasllibacter sp. MH4015]
MKPLRLAAALVLLASTASAQVLFEDNFDANPTGLNLTPAGWTVTGGSVDTVGQGTFPDICAPTGQTCIDLDGSTLDAGRLQSMATFALQPGVRYNLTFDYTWNSFAQDNGNTMIFGVGGFREVMAISETRPAEPQHYRTWTLSFDGDGTNGAIFFDHQGGDDGGIVIDNVRFSVAP